MSRALLLGATGLVGSEILTLLLADDAFSEVVVVARRPTGVAHPKLREEVFELDSMEQHARVFETEQLFCALGTTIKKAGSQERFREVDHDYPLRAARLGRAGGASHYLLVSSIGADSHSRFFYSRVKGELEDALLGLGYPRLTIARPSLLTGDRKEFRLGERVGGTLGFLMPPAYRPIAASAVARALVAAAKRDGTGVEVLESRTMRT
jgi:uncharacterized protein YbjT (DUF2867 family)